MALESSVFMCISLLAGALGRSMNDHFKEMLDGMLAGGLNPALTSALRHLALAIPPLKRAIQDGLLQMLRLVLMGRATGARGCAGLRTSGSRDLGAPAGPNTPTAAGANAAESYDSHSVTLALKTLGNFDFEGKWAGRFCDSCRVHFATCFVNASIIFVQFDEGLLLVCSQPREINDGHDCGVRS